MARRLQKAEQQLVVRLIYTIRFVERENSTCDPFQVVFNRQASLWNIDTIIPHQNPPWRTAMGKPGSRPHSSSSTRRTWWWVWSARGRSAARALLTSPSSSTPATSPTPRPCKPSSSQPFRSKTIFRVRLGLFFFFFHCHFLYIPFDYVLKFVTANSQKYYSFGVEKLIHSRFDSYSMCTRPSSYISVFLSLCSIFTLLWCIIYDFDHSLEAHDVLWFWGKNMRNGYCLTFQVNNTDRHQWLRTCKADGRNDIMYFSFLIFFTLSHFCFALI